MEEHKMELWEKITSYECTANRDPELMKKCYHYRSCKNNAVCKYLIEKNRLGHCNFFFSND